MAFECTLASLFPIKVIEQKPGIFPTYYEIPASDGSTPTTLSVGMARYFIETERGALEQRILPDDLCKAICADFISAQLATDLEDNVAAYPAIFWVEGTISAKDLLVRHKPLVEKHKEIQNRWFKNLVKMADDDWKRYGRQQVISDLQRTAARILNLTNKEWLLAIGEGIIDCPVCFSKVQSKAIVCMNCKMILKPEEYSKFQFLREGANVSLSK